MISTMHEKDILYYLDLVFKPVTYSSFISLFDITIS